MFTLERLDGTKINFNKLGLKVSKFNIDSLFSVMEYEQLDGRDGHVNFNTSFEGRSMRATFLIDAFDYQDFSLIRNVVFKLFNGKDQFYLIENKQPQKRWKVRVTSNFSIDKISRRLGTFEIDFKSDFPYAESIGTTLNPFTFETEKWQVGQGLSEDEPAYFHNTTSFNILNVGDIPIDPRELPLKITFKGESNNLIITNVTTGDMWNYTGPSISTDTITLEGIRCMKNNQSIFKDTNRKLLTLETGWNEFLITGASNFTIEFDFRFYYI